MFFKIKKKLIPIILAAFFAIGCMVFITTNPFSSHSVGKKITSPIIERKTSLKSSPQSSGIFVVTPTPTPAPAAIPTADSTSFELDSSNSSPAATDLVVPRGARVPAALLDGGGPDDSEETRNIMNNIIEEFAAKIQEAKQADRNMDEAWEEAREVADDRYRQFFGFEAFNAATLEAAGEAYEESTSLPSASGQP